MSDFIKGLWPRSPFTWLGLILGAMSVLALIQHGFNYGFGPTFTLLLAYYENLIHALIGWWVEPIIKAWLADLSAYLGLELRLYPHWKHVLVLMTAYTTRDSGTAFQAGRKATAAFRLLWGLTIAAASGVAAGLVAVAQTDVSSSFLIASIPLWGVVVYDCGRAAWGATWRHSVVGSEATKSDTWLAFFGTEAYFAARRAVVGTVLVLVGLQLPVVQNSASPGLVLFGALVLVQALWWLLVGLGVARVTRGELDPAFESYWRLGAARIGTAMLALFLWTALFVAANAGLRFYGL